MTIVSLAGVPGIGEPDARRPIVASPSAAERSFASALENAFDAAGGALAKADGSERAFARGTGGLQEMVLDRAQADIALSIATTAASRTTQALSTILGMQV